METKTCRVCSRTFLPRRPNYKSCKFCHRKHLASIRTFECRHCKQTLLECKELGRGGWCKTCSNLTTTVPCETPGCNETFDVPLKPHTGLSSRTKTMCKTCEDTHAGINSLVWKNASVDFSSARKCTHDNSKMVMRGCVFDPSLYRDDVVARVTYRVTIPQHDGYCSGAEEDGEEIEDRTLVLLVPRRIPPDDIVDGVLVRNTHYYYNIPDSQCQLGSGYCYMDTTYSRRGYVTIESV